MNCKFKTTGSRTIRKTGFTLIEILIASFISLILIGVIISVFTFGAKAYDYAAYSGSIGEETYTAVQFIKRDLEQTSLTTIRAYPNPQHPSEKSGVSLESADNLESGNFQISEFGTPKWSKYVFYTIEPGGYAPKYEKLKVGRLVRWELPLTKKESSRVPAASTMLPSRDTSGINKRTVLKHIVMPGQDIDNDGKPDVYNGFKVSFLRKNKTQDKDYDVSSVNPSLVSNLTPGLNFANNTELVSVELTLLEYSEQTGEPNLYNFSFIIKPLN